MNETEWLECLQERVGPLSVDLVRSIGPEPELLALVRQLIRPPWPEVDPSPHPADPYLPVLAAIIAGLTRDTESIAPLMAALREAYVEDWDWMIEAVPQALGSIGTPAMNAVTSRIREIEMIPETDPNQSYFYWNMISALQYAAVGTPEVFERLLAMARERVASPTLDLWLREIWISEIIKMPDERIGSLIDSFYDLVGQDFWSEVFGSRKECYEFWRESYERPPESATELLVDLYAKVDNAITTRTTEEPSEQVSVSDLDARDSAWEDDALSFEDDIQQFIREGPKIGRNDPCPCGSGKKYKKCHGRK